MLAFGVTTGVTPTGQSTYVVDNGADLKFAVIRGGSVTSTIHLADLSSIQYKGQELLATYSSTSRYSHYEQGLSSTTSITYLVDPGSSWILVTCDDSTNGVVQYYAVRDGDNNIYMSSYVTAGGEGRFLAYLSRGVFTNVEEPSNIAGNVGTVEGSDVFYLADGQTRSKFYNTRRMIENEYHGVTGTFNRSYTVGAWMYMGNRENSSGGPFFKDIDFQTTDSAVELYNVIYSGHTQTEAYRFLRHVRTLFACKSPMARCRSHPTTPGWRISAFRICSPPTSQAASAASPAGWSPGTRRSSGSATPAPNTGPSPTPPRASSALRASSRARTR